MVHAGGGGRAEADSGGWAVATVVLLPQHNAGTAALHTASAVYGVHHVSGGDKPAAGTVPLGGPGVGGAAGGGAAGGHAPGLQDAGRAGTGLDEQLLPLAGGSNAADAAPAAGSGSGSGSTTTAGVISVMADLAHEVVLRLHPAVRVTVPVHLQLEFECSEELAAGLYPTPDARVTIAMAPTVATTTAARTQQSSQCG